MLFNPKRYQEYIKPTAEELEIDSQCVRDVVDFFWKEVRKNLSDLSEPRIEVPFFGYFEIKKRKLAEKIADYERFFNIPAERMTYQKHAVIAGMQKNLNDVKAMQLKVDVQTLKLKKINELRYGKETDRSMGQQEKDPGRTHE